MLLYGAGVVTAGASSIHLVPVDLDRLIHERLRLAIVSALAVNASLTFNELKGLRRQRRFGRLAEELPAAGDSVVAAI